MSSPLKMLSKSENSNHIDMFYNFDWSSTPLGPMDTWDPAIISSTIKHLTVFAQSVCINNKVNPSRIRKQFKEIWPDKYDAYMGSDFNKVVTTGKGLYFDERPSRLERDGYDEEVYFSNTFSPIFKSDGTVGGIESLESACHIITKTLRNNKDITYTLIYLIKHKSNTSSESLIAHLMATTFDSDDKEKRNVPDYLPESHETIDLAIDANKRYDTYIEIKRSTAAYSFLKCDSWPIYHVFKEGRNVKILLNDESQAVFFPIKISFDKDHVLSVVLIYGINRLRALDDRYMEFFNLVTNQIYVLLQHGKSVEDEKIQTKILADMNYQKLTFFQGISHELKTPLALMLSPLDAVINACTQEPLLMSYLQIIYRNAHRILKLINALLQFTNIETNQLKAHYRETNIAKFTLELASDFKGMAKTLNLNYNIDIPNPDEFGLALGDKIYLDHDLYETIVFNLCSNAFKHTWKGQITVRLYLDCINEKKNMVVLEVSDTGVGISESALPNIFQRFYRVESQGSRSHEGTGIGLALVKELITLHGGDITVTSVVNQGTTFKCWFPIGCEHLLIDQIQSFRWMKDNKSETQDSSNNKELDNMNIDADETTEHDRKYKVLIVDDNNDMRDYLAELLNEFDVYRACDGQDAIRTLKSLKNLPDLILSGKADDYLVKPFSTRELICRIRANIECSILRRKILFHRYKQEDMKQLMLSIITMILSESDLDKTLLYIAKEIYHLTPIINPFSEINDNNISNSQPFTKSQKYFNGNLSVDISLNEYCDGVDKNVSILSVEIRLDDNFWGWIKVHRFQNSIWFDSEIEFLQQISNYINLVITYAKLLEEIGEKEIQIKAAEVANNAKNQILANTSHELRTPQVALVGLIPSLEGTTLTNEQKDMLNIISNAADISTIIILEKKAATKNIELIVNCELDMLPRYVKSDPERLNQVLAIYYQIQLNLLNEGEIVLTISMQPREFIEENNEENSSYDQVVKKEKVLIQLSDTGIIINPENIKYAWESFSQDGMSITKKQDGAGLGLNL
ncbi:hypothetical protein C2G38_2237965 [Gigaspora rosea]|uniref:histidine kinase n=1 Tax=Gigaspora rosea TaxID=44941 RepID=A0A397W9F6_9GLOM|nr:hypothetical protein C2G38_2237965 [Gigaspora rosea]